MTSSLRSAKRSLLFERTKTLSQEHLDEVIARVSVQMEKVSTILPGVHVRGDMLKVLL